MTGEPDHDVVVEASRRFAGEGFTKTRDREADRTAGSMHPDAVLPRRAAPAVTPI